MGTGVEEPWWRVQRPFWQRVSWWMKNGKAQWVISPCQYFLSSFQYLDTVDGRQKGHLACIHPAPLISQSLSFTVRDSANVACVQKRSVERRLFLSSNQVNEAELSQRDRATLCQNSVNCCTHQRDKLHLKSLTMGEWPSRSLKVIGNDAIR